MLLRFFPTTKTSFDMYYLILIAEDRERSGSSSFFHNVHLCYSRPIMIGSVVSRPGYWMKLDPEGYEAELLLIYGHFESSLHLFLQQSVLSSSSDPVVSKDLGDLTMFLHKPSSSLSMRRKDSVIYFSYRITNLCDYKNAGDGTY
ncbi:hypothetical protein HPP92_027652 [Vanilla planifolia]|uniref:Uncharacterized protein n=1 Tax=Vanilla planifolia TaxID=51239 RepID=A0A835P953_VANPL|nr:hypothetical protein HPP92_027652 [Vanilla planifolia]